MNGENKRRGVYPMFIWVKLDCTNEKGRTSAIYRNVIRKGKIRVEPWNSTFRSVTSEKVTEFG